MVEGDPGIAALLDAARADFSRALPAKVAAFDALLEDGAFADAKRAAHKLRGSAGMFGFAALGRIAGAIDDLMTEAAPDASTRARVDALAADLRAEAARAERDGR